MPVISERGDDLEQGQAFRLGNQRKAFQLKIFRRTETGQQHSSRGDMHIPSSRHRRSSCRGRSRPEATFPRPPGPGHGPIELSAFSIAAAELIP